MADDKLIEEVNREVKDDFSIYSQSTNALISDVKIIHNIINKQFDLQEEIKKAVQKESRQINSEDNERNTKSKQQVLEILERLEYGAVLENEKSDKKEEKFKVPSLRFAEINKTHYEDIKDELKRLSDSIYNDYGITVLLIENIDIKNCTGDKFYILLKDKNDNTTVIDLLQYQRDIYDFTVNEEETIKNEIIKLKGVYDIESIEAAKKIAKYISLALGYKETFTYQYRFVGWDIISIEKEQYKIFKYDTIYSNRSPKLKGLCGEEWADAIKRREDQTGEGKRLWNEFMAQTFNDAVVADIILCAGVSGIVRQALTYSKENNINMNIVASKGSGKSTMQHLILSFFGNPEQLEGSFIDTENASEQIRVERAIVPYVLDERMLKVENDSDSKKALTMIMSIFREYEGKLKNKIGAQYNNSNIHTYGAIISSSVESILEQINKEYKKDDDTVRDLGQYRRFIEITAKREDLFKDGEHAKAADNLAYSKYGYGVEQIVLYMLNLVRYEYYIERLIDLGEQKISVADILFFVDCIEDALNNKDVVPEIEGYYSIRATYICGDDQAKYNEVISFLTEDKRREGSDSDIFKHIFDALYRMVISEVDLKTHEYKNGLYYDEMETSVQRFALLKLTGLLLNHCIGDDIESTQLSMDMDAVVDYLINNLYDKLGTAKVINYSRKEINYTKKVVELYDWLKNADNMKYFDKTSVKGFVALVEEKGNELSLWIQKNTTANPRKISLNTILANLDASAEHLLMYENGDILLKNEDWSVDDVNSILATGLITLDNTDKQQSNLKGRRGYLYKININEVEKVRRELQGQEESTNEAN